MLIDYKKKLIHENQINKRKGQIINEYRAYY